MFFDLNINIVYVIFSFFTPFIILINFYTKLKLIDKPHPGKQNSAQTPLIGGLILSIFIFFTIFYNTYNDKIFIIIILSFLISILGALDDAFSLRPVYRILIQIFLSVIAIEAGIYVVEIGSNLFFFIDFSITFFAFLLTILSILALTNSFNFIDGIDGLCIITALTSLISISLFSYFEGTQIDYLFFGYIIFALVILLFFNFGFFKIKIFLGDSGSTYLGFIIALFLIYYSRPEIGILHPILTIWCIAYPIFDTINIFINRLLNKKNILDSDRSHLHYRLLDSGFSILKSNLIIFLFSFSLNLSGYLIYKITNPEFALLFYLICLIIYIIYSKKLFDNLNYK